MKLQCSKCKKEDLRTVPPDWEIYALCPGCVERRNASNERRAELARRLLQGDATVVEAYLEELTLDGPPAFPTVCIICDGLGCGSCEEELNPES